MNEPYIERDDVINAHADLLAMLDRAQAIVPRIAVAKGVHDEQALAKLANLYARLIHGLMKVADLHDEFIEDPRFLALRRSLKPYHGL